MLLINCSNREKNCFKILNDIKKDNDKLISLSNKDMKFCLGCEKCQEYLEKHCVLDDYISNNVYDEIINENDIVFACPMYMSNINGILKNLLDRFNPLYNHELLKGKNIYLIMTGYASKEDNQDEINGIINYFNGMTEWMMFNFEFLEYISLDDSEYDNKINSIKERLGE